MVKRKIKNKYCHQQQPAVSGWPCNVIRSMSKSGEDARLKKIHITCCSMSRVDWNSNQLWSSCDMARLNCHHIITPRHTKHLCSMRISFLFWTNEGSFHFIISRIIWKIHFVQKIKKQQAACDWIMKFVQHSCSMARCSDALWMNSIFFNGKSNTHQS